MKNQLFSALLAAAMATSAFTPSAVGAPKGFTVTLDGGGTVSGVIEDMQLKGDLKLKFQGSLEIAELGKAIVGHKVLRNDRSKKIEVWISRADIEGDVLVVRGGGRYEDRVKLPFGGWTKVYSQSGNLEIRLRVTAKDGKPVVSVVSSSIELGGILGDVVKLFNLDRSIESRIKPIVQAAVNEQIHKNLPTAAGNVTEITIKEIGFVTYGPGRYGVDLAASATVKLTPTVSQ